MVDTRDYVEQVYAGVLGKIIGVYLGRPFEGWTYERIMSQLGEVQYYVNDRLNMPLVVTDDDISGTFTFLRAIEDNPEVGKALTSPHIAETWLNYIIENLSILWWGGKGISSEHTAFLRLKEGVPAPESGSIGLNGAIMAQQVGAQIFIEGWGLVAPGDPELAVKLAGEAGRVSHDGESVVGAQMIAAMVALAFELDDARELVTAAREYIDKGSLINRLIGELVELREKQPDWRTAREYVAGKYGYDKYGGGCHIVPNHALDIIGLLYSNNNFQRGLMVTNTSGWDTDCNSANVGCILGVLGGLEGIADGPDFRGPVADKIYLPTADGGRAITDAVQETYRIVNSARALVGIGPSDLDKGARFNFSMPGSVQGFHLDPGPETCLTARLENVQAEGFVATGANGRVLSVEYSNLAPGLPLRVRTATFVLPDAMDMPAYTLMASPTLYPGQTVSVRVAAPGDVGAGKSYTPPVASLFVQTYEPEGSNTARPFRTHKGDPVSISPEFSTIDFPVPDTEGAPVVTVGLEIGYSPEGARSGRVLIDNLTWEGGVATTLYDPSVRAGTRCNESWIRACDRIYFWHAMVVSNSIGPGFALNGTREWSDYSIRADIVPRLFERGGVVFAFNGLRRYMTAVLTAAKRLELVENWDGVETVLADGNCVFDWSSKIEMQVTYTGPSVEVRAGEVVLRIDTPKRLASGAVGLYVESGSLQVGTYRVSPA